VWFDALASYLASLGLGGGGDGELLRRYWLAGDERIHVIGKGIKGFHAVYWPAFLLSAGLPLPDRIAVHGYLTVDGAKIAKSGRSLEVGPIVEQLGADALRWYFLRRWRTRTDSDVDTAAIAAAHDRDLADGLGNLVQRTTALAARLPGASIRPPDAEPAEAAQLRGLAEALPARVDAAVDRFLLDEAAGAVVELIDAANRALDRTAPWRIARADPTSRYPAGRPASVRSSASPAMYQPSPSVIVSTPRM
jgi:methionyl-tRNA synthetase